MFADVSAHVPPLDFDELPAYLPAKDPPPHLYPWEVYNELRKINPNKSSGPDGVSARLIKEFAYEISVPFTDILNCSFKEGIVPHQWKKAIVVLIPKQTTARIDELRPVSLTSIFAKIAEGFVCSWALNDISDIIDKKQFGNAPGVSTSHYILNLPHFLHVGAEESHNVGTKDLRGNPKPRVSPDRTGPDRNRSGVGEHFKEYFWVGSGRGILFRVGPGRGILFRVGPGRGIFLPGYETFSPGISGINLPFIPKLRK